MTFHRIEPEVAGGLGPSVDYDPRRDPRLVGPLHYEFQGWLGDEIVDTSGFWIVTADLAATLTASTLQGYRLEPALTTKDAQYDALPHAFELPREWQRLVPTGTAGVDDFGLEGRTRLIVSDAALQVLRTHRVDHAELSAADEEAPVSDVMRRFLERQASRDA